MNNNEKEFVGAKEAANEADVAHFQDAEIPSEAAPQTTNEQIFDLLTLFLLIFILFTLLALIVGALFNNWYLGLILGAFLGTLCALIAITICRKKSK